MKIWNYITLCTVICSVTVKAETKGKWDEGVSGNAMLLFGVTQSNSQANSGDDEIQSLDEKGSTTTEPFIYPIASSQISYTFKGGNQQAVLGTSSADIALGRPHFEIGYAAHINSIGTLKLSYIPGLLSTTVWEDPFLVGDKRKETDQRIEGVRLQYQNILDTQLSAEFAVGKNKLDDEMSAGQYSPGVQSLLNREGELYFSEISYVTPLSSQLFLRSSASYLRHNADGNAMSSDTYTGQLGVLKKFESALLTVNFKYKYANFDESHPIFMEKRKDDIVSLLATYMYNDIFDWNGVGIVLMGGFSQNSSNLDFYQSENWILGSGVRYEF